MTKLARRAPAAQQVCRRLLDLVFPPRCVACRRPGEWFCAACQAKIEPIHPPICSRCGRPLSHNVCVPCSRAPLTIDGLRAAAFFEGGLRVAIHHLKYRNGRLLAPLLAGLLDDYLSANPIPGDVLIPVPLHVERERERGYNQSTLLARELAARRGLALWYNGIRRIRSTRPQIDLDTSARFENVRQAFAVTTEVAGARILLIDDVCTTGATLDACAVALKERGAKSVWGLTLARGR